MFYPHSVAYHIKFATTTLYSSKQRDIPRGSNTFFLKRTAVFPAHKITFCIKVQSCSLFLFQTITITDTKAIMLCVTALLKQSLQQAYYRVWLSLKDYIMVGNVLNTWLYYSLPSVDLAEDVKNVSKQIAVRFFCLRKVLLQKHLGSSFPGQARRT